MNVFTRTIDRWTEALTPAHLRQDIQVYKRVRMFILSHLFGPFLGHPVTIYLFLNDPNPWPHVHILGLSVTLFWFFPIALHFFPRRYELLAITSVANLNFAILITAYHFGGVSSPLLMWFLVVPLLAFFYLGSGLRTSLAIFAQIVIGLGAFYAFYLMNRSFPMHIPLEEMVDVTMISMLCASLYIFFMASYYASVVDSQSELLKEIDRHQATMDDLTAAKEEAERANGAKSDFLAKMSHELRTPLNAVLGYSEILLEDAELDGNGEQIADLQKISAAGKHLLAMVNDILDISKIEAGKTELFLEDVDLDQLIEEIEVTARPLAAKNTNVFEVIKDDALGVAHLDLTKLRQATFNLLSNAAKFCQNGKITLEVKRIEKDGRPTLSMAVHDTGVGISEEALAGLFQNFAQAHASINAKFGGTGLGLSLSKNLCRLMGGDITADSVLGKGSVFTITVPMEVEAVAPEAMSEEAVDATLKDAAAELRKFNDADKALSAGAGANTQSRGTVLVIDDDPEYLEIMDRMLRKESFSPILTSDPASALHLARTVRPSLMLIDVLMPDVDGWELVEKMKDDPVTRPIPVIMVSIMDDPKTNAPQLADGFMSKPVDSAKLRKTLQLHFGKNAA
ncbi:MAG: response regulator [Roseitalea sp.]|jgi:signal transduction histidine kinase|nr:response regulator [Roseitalea sp.]MBO6721826.1 response regulator [Roseitalea sp.]MBO6744860.1 response regulator [Roseitalea sp.]